MIGVDSGLSHVAVALDLPHVQIYNFDTAWRTGPLPAGDGRHGSMSVQGRAGAARRCGVERMARGEARRDAGRSYSLAMIGVQPLLRRKLRRRGDAEPGYLHAVDERFGWYSRAGRAGRVCGSTRSRSARRAPPPRS